MRALLSQLPDFVVVCEAVDGPSAIAAAERLSPDIVVTELALRGMSGVQVITRLREIREDIECWRLPRSAARSTPARSGYLLKSWSPELLRHGLAAVGRGETFLDPTLEREREVLVSVARGYSNKEIAAQIQLSVKTVETYRSRGTEKLGRSNLVRVRKNHGSTVHRMCARVVSIRVHIIRSTPLQSHDWYCGSQ